MADSLSDRLNRIIKEQNISKRDFARRIGVGETYVYVITGGGRKNNLNQNISPLLARVIGTEFGYDPEWILNGTSLTATAGAEQLRKTVLEQIEQLSCEELVALSAFLNDMHKK